MSPLPPGSTIGILGGGQLGRMLALAAARLGLKCHIYCPDAASPAFDVSAKHTCAPYENEAALAAFAELPEAARVDGANEWQVFWHVTLPRLQPIMMILVVLRFGTAMAVIDEYLIFGGFNRASPTYTWTMFMYEQAFKTGLWRQGFAAAIGMIGALAMMMVVAWLVYVFRSKD